MFSRRFPFKFLKILMPPKPAAPITPKFFSSSRKISAQIKRRIAKSSSRKQNPDPKVHSAEKIRKIYNILKYSTWDSAQEQLQILPFKWDSYTVNQVLKTHPPMQKAWLFFNWAAGRNNFKHDQYTYTTMLDIFGEARRVSSMMYVFEQMKERSVKIDVVTYTSLMHWVSDAGDVERAIGLWEEMKAKGCRPTIVSYTAYMKILFDHEKVAEGIHVYKEILRSGLSPNCHTYTVLMEYLAKSGKFDEAMEIFNKMQEASVQPDKAACNALIEICSIKGERGTLLKILDYMAENFIALRYSVYRNAVDALEPSEECSTLLRQIHPHFLNRDAAVETRDLLDPENSLISMLIGKQNLVAVDTLLADTMGKIPNTVRLATQVVSRVIEANCALNRRHGALLAYEYSTRAAVKVERNAYLALIGMSIRLNLYREAVEIVEEMVERGGFSMGTHLTSLLIHRLGCTALAEKVFSLLPDKDKGPTEYTALMSAYLSTGDIDKGVETFRTMRSKGVCVTVGTLSVLIGGLERSGRSMESERYKKEKKQMQLEMHSMNGSMEEKICNLLFLGDFSW